MAETFASTGAETAGNTAISLDVHPGQHAACDAEIARLRARLDDQRDRIAAAVKDRADELAREAVSLSNAGNASGVAKGCIAFGWAQAAELIRQGTEAIPRTLWEAS